MAGQLGAHKTPDWIKRRNEGAAPRGQLPLPHGGGDALRASSRASNLPLLTVRPAHTICKRGAAMPPLKHRERRMLRQFPQFTATEQTAHMDCCASRSVCQASLFKG